MRLNGVSVGTGSSVGVVVCGCCGRRSSFCGGLGQSLDKNDEFN